MTTTPDQRPRVVIRPPTRWTPVRLSELWEFRDLLRAFAVRDVKLRYRQTALGAIWVVAQPLLTAGIFAFVFGRVADLPSEGIPYFVFSYAGLLAWNAFSSTLTKSSGSLVANQAMISKVFFPRLLLPLSVIGPTLIDFAVGGTVMAALLIAYELNPGPALAFLPLWLVFLLALATGVGLVTSALMVKYRDVQYVLPVAIQMLLFATPIAYTVSAVPESARLYVMANPLAGLLDAFRWSLLGTGTLHIGGLVWSAVAAMLSLLTGLWFFTTSERDFADVI